MASEYFLTLKHEALKLGDYTKYSIDDLANNYCKAVDENDQDKMSTYIAALMMRFWNQVSRMAQKVQTTNYDLEELPSKLFECINIACQYRAWQDPEKHTNAQACINSCIAARGAAAILYESNLKKNSGQRYTISLDEEIDEDSGLTIGDMIEDPHEMHAYDTTYSIVQECINEQKYVEAVITDLIAHADANMFKVESKVVKDIDEDGKMYKYTDRTTEFNPRMLMKAINQLDTKYIKYFTETYQISELAAKLAYDRLKTAKSNVRYQLLAATTNFLKTIV